MSSINTSVDQTLLQYVQSLSGSQATTPTQQLIAAIESQSTDTQSQSAQSPSTQSPGGLFGKIAAAVTSALQSSNGTTDANTVIQNAIASVLSQGSSTSSSSPLLSPDSDGDSDSSSIAAQDSLDGVTPSGGSTPSSFLQTLQKAGVDPQQFRQDLVAALQSSSGQTNLSDLSDAFLVGTVVDQLA